MTCSIEARVEQHRHDYESRLRFELAKIREDTRDMEMRMSQMVTQHAAQVANMHEEIVYLRIQNERLQEL